MTLLAVHAEPHRARILFDQLHYNAPATFAEPARIPKGVVLPGLDAASACAGDFDVALAWQTVARAVARRFDGLDEFAIEFPGVFRRIQRQRWGDESPELAAWVVGWSPGRGRFVALSATSMGGFRFEDASDAVNIMPAPTGYAPTAAEQRCRASAGRDPLPDGDPYPPPASDADWADLALEAHEERAEALDDTKVLIGGDVTLLELTRAGVERRVVHRFDAADRAAMLRGTVHRSQQLGPCICGSGVRMLDCHLPEVFDKPCICRSGRTFRDCCRVQDAPPVEPAQPAASSKVGRNDPCPCGSGAKHKRCCALAAV